MNKEKGGLALEYVLVTTFAAIAATLVLGVLGAIAKKKGEELAKKYNVEFDFSELE